MKSRSKQAKTRALPEQFLFKAAKQKELYNASPLDMKKLMDMLPNPPFGVKWKKVEHAIRKEHESQGFNGRFGPGLP